MSDNSRMTAQELRQKLVTRQQEILARVERIEADIQRRVPADFEEQATARENDEVLDRLDETGRAELESIRAALARIDADGFNTCSRCGAPIGMERLDIVPTAVLCMNCAG